MQGENLDLSNIKLDKELRLQDDFQSPSYDEWRKKVEIDLKGAPFEKKLITKTYEGINLQPIYTRKDIENLPQTDDVPGYSNLIRGTKVSGYVGKSWDVCQELPYGDAEEFNAALKSDLQRGQNSINVKLDTATKLGLDSDYAKKEEVGNGGLAISALKSITRAFDGIELEKYPLYIQAGFNSVPMLMALAAYLKKEGKEISALKGAVEADPLGYLVENGEMPVSFEFAMNKMKLAAEWTKKNATGLKTISVSGIPYGNGGASAVQELAYVMATAVEYIEQLLERGLAIDEIAQSMRLSFNVGPFYFMEIAKFRAARVLWANIMDAYGASEESKKVLIHAKTSVGNQTAYDPYVNMLRTTTEAFSAVVGGIDSLHTNPFDETFSVPNEFSRRISRNVQILLSEESHMDKLIDPAGGSFYVEKLTDEVANAAWTEFQTIQEKGGMFKALQENYPQDAIKEVVAARKKNIDKRKDAIVGNNMYANPKEEKIAPKKADTEALYQKRAEFLQKYRVAGDAEKHKPILEKLNSLVGKDDVSLIETGINAFVEGATLGEIASALKAANGKTVAIEKVEIFKLTAEFEALRDASKAFEEKTGAKPKLFLANMGHVRQFKPRADFARGFFEVAGLDIIYTNGFETPEEAAKAAIESGAKAVCVCSTDDTYPEIVPGLAKSLKEQDSEITLILAGYPKDQIEAHKASGVDEFIYLGCDAYNLLAGLMTKIGARG